MPALLGWMLNFNAWHCVMGERSGDLDTSSSNQKVNSSLPMPEEESDDDDDPGDVIEEANTNIPQGDEGDVIGEANIPQGDDQEDFALEEEVRRDEDVLATDVLPRGIESADVDDDAENEPPPAPIKRRAVVSDVEAPGGMPNFFKGTEKLAHRYRQAVMMAGDKISNAESGLTPSASSLLAASTSYEKSLSALGANLNAFNVGVNHFREATAKSHEEKTGVLGQALARGLEDGASAWPDSP